ncbi:restriction endonuclease subunit S [Escherichia coli]|uniref:Restriction endonuclease subunit S n=3 Tax=Enterobacteriaceae TaxID=543 RepID=A0AAE5JW47_SHISO|nr:MULTISPECIES: restriction endonuclease subunit S [Enterobacteriaceae]EFB6859285.1 restriction endonuclease subunit S [Escherichia coli]EFC1460847.1 restriction endonuclease subunit S [Escherichia coli]EFH5338805.1 restriction endonuclease subunit S [Escherichia coli]EFN3867889.1 restriction endonuclease subunit S [Escherichia coli]EGO4394196.1 restriction endonuclease subunit S [Escherichia coli]
MVPKGWEKNSLDSLFEFKNGLNTEKEQYGNGYKFVNVMDVFRNDILTESKIIGRVQVTDKQLEGYQLKYGDVLFNRTSETFDEIAIAAIYLDNAIATFGGFVIRARPKGNQIDPAYSVFLFQSKSYRSQVVKLGQGAIRANIGQKDLARVCILVPPLAEQKKIAQILSTWDNAISVTEKLLANSQQQKKALMQQLLTGQKRLLDENGVRFSGEWVYLTFDNAFIVANKKSTQVKSSDYLQSGSIPIIDQGQSRIAGYCNNLEVYSDVPVIVFGDHTRCVKWIEFVFCPGADGTQVIKTSKILEPKLGYYLLSNTDIPNLGYSRHMRELKEKDFRLPLDIKEQQKIAAVLSAADAEISTLEKKLACLRDEKKALMQQLLTGKRRVKVDEAVAE